MPSPLGPVPFHYPAPSLAQDFGGHRHGEVVGRQSVVPHARQLAALGKRARLLGLAGACCPPTLAGFGLVGDQVHFLGNYSLAIIGVSGLFVGFVLGLQGYYTLQRYGSAEALGLLVALSLLRELGPVVTALLFAGRAGTALTAEIGLMKAGEQLAAMEMMAVSPVRRILAPRFGPVSSPCRCWPPCSVPWA